MQRPLPRLSRIVLEVIFLLTAVFLAGIPSVYAGSEQLSDLPSASWRSESRLPASVLALPPEARHLSDTRSAREAAMLSATAGMRRGVVAGVPLSAAPFEPSLGVKAGL